MDGYVTVTEAAKRKGVSRFAIWKAIERGTLKAEMFGSVWAIPEAELERYDPRSRHKPGNGGG